MGSRLYIGNLPYAIRDHDLHQTFSPFGTVVSAHVILERDTGRSKGFGFVEMSSDSEAVDAMRGVNGQTLGGRSLVVNEVCPLEQRPARQNNGSTQNHGHAGRNDGGFRSPYGTNMRNRNNPSRQSSHSDFSNS